MAAGGPGDHPVIDIVDYGLEIYNAKCDELIREISNYVSRDEQFGMYDWFHELPLSNERLKEFERSLTTKRDQLRLDAKERGWEIE